MTRAEKIDILDTWCSEKDDVYCETCKTRLKQEDVPCLSFICRTDAELDEALKTAIEDDTREMGGRGGNAYRDPDTSLLTAHEQGKQMTRSDILAKAAECVTGHRVDDYGKPEDSFGRIAQLWTCYNGHEYTAHDVAMMLALLKVARISTGHGGADSYVDLAGYAACAGELAGAQRN